ncbi:hypothetical protein WR25_05975 [Diploscapter pachys]|uniref:Uncharacterized protein n=1 Tax=Diploscapter pachys TaxID=2018661 RepID=A0A2A2LQ55_9BILA|nr:hypothetical protein WR25_05975 [Diploscapter pachys]
MPAFSKGRRKEPQKLTKKSQKKKFMLQSIEMRRMPPQSAVEKNENIRGIRGSSHRKGYFLQLVKAETAGEGRRILGCDTSDENPFPNAQMRKCLMQNGPEDISHLNIFYRNSFETASKGT